MSQQAASTKARIDYFSDSTYLWKAVYPNYRTILGWT